MPWCVIAAPLYAVTIVGRWRKCRFDGTPLSLNSSGVHALECQHWEDIPLSTSANFDRQSRITLSGPIAQSDIQSRKNLVSIIIVCDTVKFQVLEHVIIGDVIIDAQLVDGLFIFSSP